MKIKFLFFLILITLIILISGCNSEPEYLSDEELDNFIEELDAELGEDLGDQNDIEYVNNSCHAEEICD